MIFYVIEYEEAISLYEPMDDDDWLTDDIEEARRFQTREKAEEWMSNPGRSKFQAPWKVREMKMTVDFIGEG